MIKILILSKAGGLDPPFQFHMFFGKAFLVLGFSVLHLGYFGLNFTYELATICSY